MARILTLFLLILLFSLPGNSFAATADQFIDPMRPVRYQTPVAKKTAQDLVNTADWQLTAVLISAQRSVAVINGKSLREGDMVDGYRVVKISYDKVCLKNKQHKLVLRRAGTGLKKISPGQDVGKGSKP
ncbi:MAG: hypothetical protein U9R69_09815 [Thermodesulfobacteriota bacterium]|nr:hypothetical protein [Thermodesulfobacteriota bacterium]